MLMLPADDLAAKQKRDVNKVRREQQATRKEIKETSRKITVNTRETKKQMSRLSTLSGEITAKNKEITHIRRGVDSIDARLSTVNDSIAILDTRMAALRDSYIKSLRSIQGTTGNMSQLAFIFASESFSEAYRRLRYMQEFSRWSKRKNEEIKHTTTLLAERRAVLDTMMRSRRRVMAQLTTAQKELESAKAETDKVVARLKSEGSSLKAYLKEKEQQARRLDNELDRLIAEEQRRIERERKEQERKEREQKKKTTPNKGTSTTPAKKTTPKSDTSTATAAADRALTGSFESNKGRLLFPVAGKYRIVRGFGRQKHPELEHVETDNSGIDIEAIGSRNVRAVFDGKVSAIFRQPGYGNIIMIRHGNYLTIYANLDGISVKNGDSVKTGQTIGTILVDPEEDNRAILHFELRKERTKLNPALWVR
ncbi:MAG: peptidoglycan DD-metalloendopeptidase family protein [Paramuribaculum sp.]|nr:peptidoglycan DD-metalloendopeptidase family protein [Paramuribaculum sp.]